MSSMPAHPQSATTGAASDAARDSSLAGGVPRRDESATRARCQTKDAPPADDWFQRDDESTSSWHAREKQLIRWHCAGCPLMWQCRRDAVERGEQYGVWGGLTE